MENNSGFYYWLNNEFQSGITKRGIALEDWLLRSPFGAIIEERLGKDDLNIEKYLPPKARQEYIEWRYPILPVAHIFIYRSWPPSKERFEFPKFQLLTGKLYAERTSLAGDFEPFGVDFGPHDEVIPVSKWEEWFGHDLEFMTAICDLLNNQKLDEARKRIESLSPNHIDHKYYSGILQALPNLPQ